MSSKTAFQNLFACTAYQPKNEYTRRVLPKRFVRIRHYGFLTNRGKTTRLNTLRKTMGLEQMKPRAEIPVAVRLIEKFGKDISQCTHCTTGSYELLFTKRFDKITYRKPPKITV